MILDIHLTGACVLFLPLIVLLVNLYRKKSSGHHWKTRALLSDINMKLSRSIEGFTSFRPLAKRNVSKRVWCRVRNTWFTPANSMSLDSLFLRPAMSLLKLLGYAVLMAYFGYRGIYLGITAGTMYAFIQYINLSLIPWLKWLKLLNLANLVSAGRVFALIDRHPMQRDTVPKVEGTFVLKMFPSPMMVTQILGLLLLCQ